VKLCRFDLADSRGTARSGFVYGGKIYETDGVNPIAVHDPGDARLLAPVGRPPSVRLFSAVKPAYAEWIEEGEAEPAPHFSYLNPSLLAGPNSAVPAALHSWQVACKPCLAAVVDEGGRDLSSQEAESRILGICLGMVFYAIDLERDDLAKGLGSARSHDVGFAVGPALTTPDEIDDLRLADGADGDLTVSAFVGEAQFLDVSLADTHVSLSEAVSSASRSCALAAGDLILLALGTSRTDEPLEPGAVVRVHAERLGALVMRYG
jgi:2-keto-4-pentenoate hydratase/2-oxohepta-3-ene-1,7-dioic acid hydratase in catechol pathway